METARTNPLLDPAIEEGGIPPFDRLELDDYIPALEAAIAQQREELAAIKANPEPPTFENTLLALERSSEPLDWVARVYLGLMNAHADQAMRALAQDFLPKLSEHETDLWLDPVLFERIASLREGAAKAGLDPEQLRLVEKRYRDALRSGARLEGEDRERLKAISSELSALGPRFSRNVLANC